MIPGPSVFIVATPIGNLDDLTVRARQTLAGVDVIAAEDTRQTRRLLSHLDIRGKRLVSYQDHGEAERAVTLVKEIQEGSLSLAMVSDAGTPCISDPGYRLVQAAKAAGVPVHPIPGPSALTALVSASGLPSDRLLFIGFLPAKEAARKQEIASWAAARASVVFFESARRLVRSLAEISAIYPEARVAIGRELSKLFEEITTSSVNEALTWADQHATLKGEVTVMVAPGKNSATAQGGGPGDAESILADAGKAFRAGATLKDLLRKYHHSGLSRSELYALLLRAKAPE